MSAYYQYVNITKREVICMSDVWGIKASSYSGWSLQTAILQVFLGGPDWNEPASMLRGSWQGDAIAVECDECGPNWTDATDEEWLDAGMLFLVELRAANAIGDWFNSRGLTFIDFMDSAISNWLQDNAERTPKI